MDGDAFPVFASAHHLADLPVALLVLAQTLGGDEALPALLALVRLVVVDLLVILEVADAREADATVAALEEPALDVSQQMLLQAAGLLESLPTVAAVVVTATFGAVVSEFVQRGWETVPTFDTQVRSVLAFAQPVAGQQRGRPEGSAALGAVVRLEARVEPLVLDEDRVVLEHLVALGAFVHP